MTSSKYLCTAPELCTKLMANHEAFFSEVFYVNGNGYHYITRVSSGVIRHVLYHINSENQLGNMGEYDFSSLYDLRIFSIKKDSVKSSVLRAITMLNKR